MSTTDTPLKQAQLSVFMAISGCSCFLCHCEDWQKVKLSLKEFRPSSKGGFIVSHKVLDREQKRMRARNIKKYGK